jgi:signal transduction histidine kinase
VIFMTTTVERTDVPGRAAAAGDGWRSGAGFGLGMVVIAAGVWSAAMALDGGATAEQLVRAALLVIWGLCGAIAARRQRDDATPLLLLGAAMLAGIASVGAESLAKGDPVMGRSGAETIRAVGLALAPAFAFQALLAMPAGVLKTSGRKTLAGIGYGIGTVVAVVLLAERPDVPPWAPLSEIVFFALVGGPAAVSRYERATIAERRRIKWLAWSVTVSVGIAVSAAALHALVSWPDHVVAIALAATAVVPIAFVVAAFERPAVVVDRLLLHTISLAGLVALVSVVYVAIVLGLGRVPREDERNLLVLSILAAGAAALLYVPTRERLQRVATKLVYGERQAPDEVIRTFGSRMSRALPLDELLLQMAESLRKTLQLDVAEVWTGSGGALERSVSDPVRPPARLQLGASEMTVVARAGISGPAWLKIWLPAMLGPEEEHLRVAPITNAGELLGLIVVRRRSDRGAFDEEEERIITELARQVGLALRNVRLDSALQASLEEVRQQAAELQASRARIVAAADQERRKIERNLHDGAQQRLVALAVNLRLARQIAATAPEDANAMFDQLGTEITETLEDLRALAHGIYPPLLADRGLTEALRAAAGRSPVPTTVIADGLVRYPPEIEAAIYFCCLEAMQNIGKYAGEGATAELHIREEAGALLFDVTDNGAGFDVSNAKPGAGFANMNDRVGAIGGSLRVESAPGKGTKVAGTVPLPA